MTSLAQWVEGARPRTLPNAVAPVLVGTGAALGAGELRPGRAVLALVVALAMVIGVNYANDYSDGIRGTDDRRVGPMRLVGSGAATPAAVRTAAGISFATAVLAGATLVSLSQQWWLLGVGAVSILAAWYYTGGRRPYGYRALGELAVFVFFGPVAVLGTAYVQSGLPSALAIAASVGVGALSAAVLVANNLRDLATDAASGKRTLAVLLGERDTRRLYALLVAAPFLISALTGVRSLPMLIGLLALPTAISPVRRVLRGATGRRLVRVLRDTAMALLAWSVCTGAGLALALHF